MAQLNSEEKKEVLAMPTIAVWSDLGGIEIKKIEYGVDDYVLCVTDVDTASPRPRRLKIKYRKDRAYIKCAEYDLYLDNALKTNI